MPGLKDSGRQPPDVTGLLTAWTGGDRQALKRLLPVMHGELYRLARRHMAGERIEHTLQPTALVNEVFLRLVDLQDAPFEGQCAGRRAERGQGTLARGLL